MKKGLAAAVVFTLCISMGAVLMITEKAPAAGPASPVFLIAGAQTPTDDSGDDNGSGCISIAPPVIQVDGQNDVTQNITVTLTREDLREAGVTRDELELLEVTFSDSCADYIAIDAESLSIDSAKLQISAAVTVAGTAPDTTACTLQVADPAGVFVPPLNCEASFAIESAPASATECALTSISPSSIDTGLGLVPRIVRLTIVGNGGAQFSNSSKVAFGVKGIYPLAVVAKSGSTVDATVVVWQAPKGQCEVSVDGCGGATLDIK